MKNRKLKPPIYFAAFFIGQLNALCESFVFFTYFFRSFRFFMYFCIGNDDKQTL